MDILKPIMPMKKKPWVLIFVSLFFAFAASVGVICGKTKARHSDRFMYQINTLARASLRYHELNQGASALSSLELFQALSGENERSIVYWSKADARNFKFSEGSIHGPDMESIEVFFGDSEVVVIVSTKKPAYDVIEPIQAMRVR